MNHQTKQTRGICALISSFGLVGWTRQRISVGWNEQPTLYLKKRLLKEVVGIDVPNPDKQQKRVETDNIKESDEAPSRNS